MAEACSQEPVVVYEDVAFPEACVGQCPQIGRWLQVLNYGMAETSKLEGRTKLKLLSELATQTACKGPWDDQTEMAPVLYCSGNPNSMYGV